MDGATLWRTRVTWALVGAGATLAIASLYESTEPDPDDATRTGEHVAAHVEAMPAIANPAAPPISAEPAALPISAEPSSEPFFEPLPSTEPSPEPIATAPAPVTAFEIPLPLMPGARVMKRGQRPDEELGGTIYTLTLSVPAPGMQVESFYRRALADEKLSVAGGSTTPSSIGSGLRTSLRGRGRDASVHVNLQQRAGKLRTTVRIIWRSLP